MPVRKASVTKMCFNIHANKFYSLSTGP